MQVLLSVIICKGSGIGAEALISFLPAQVTGQLTETAGDFGGTVSRFSSSHE